VAHERRCRTAAQSVKVDSRSLRGQAAIELEIVKELERPRRCRRERREESRAQRSRRSVAARPRHHPSAMDRCPDHAPSSHERKATGPASSGRRATARASVEDGCPKQRWPPRHPAKLVPSEKIPKLSWERRRAASTGEKERPLAGDVGKRPVGDQRRLGVHVQAFAPIRLVHAILFGGDKRASCAKGCHKRGPDRKNSGALVQITHSDVEGQPAPDSKWIAQNRGPRVRRLWPAAVLSRVAELVWQGLGLAARTVCRGGCMAGGESRVGTRWSGRRVGGGAHSFS